MSSKTQAILFVAILAGLLVLFLARSCAPEMNDVMPRIPARERDEPLGERDVRHASSNLSAMTEAETVSFIKRRKLVYDSDGKAGLTSPNGQVAETRFDEETPGTASWWTDLGKAVTNYSIRGNRLCLLDDEGDRCWNFYRAKDGTVVAYARWNPNTPVVVESLPYSKL
jgi:hypothetical protein